MSVTRFLFRNHAALKKVLPTHSSSTTMLPLAACGDIEGITFPVVLELKLEERQGV